MRSKNENMEFDWDDNKAEANVKKHEISFHEARTVFEDYFTVTVIDEEHSIDELRYITIGQSASGRLLVVCHTFKESKIRIISARKPTKSERKRYENE
jgi:uncharacterized DUF497 family protein